MAIGSLLPLFRCRLCSDRNKRPWNYSGHRYLVMRRILRFNFASLLFKDRAGPRRPAYRLARIPCLHRLSRA